MLPPPYWRSGFWESSSTANSSISDSDASCSQKPSEVSVRQRVHRADGRSAQLRRRSLAVVPSVAAVSGDVLGGYTDAECRPDPKPAIRHRLHGHIAGDSFPAARHRSHPRRPLAEIVDDGVELARTELCVRRGDGARSEAGSLATR